MKASFKQNIIIAVCLLYALLFIYAATSKLLDFSNFQVQIAQSPLLSAYAGIVAPAVILVEYGIVFLLWKPALRKIGLYLALGLMSAFTIYIYLILNYSDFIPCSCGGILEKMGWTEHLIFNIVFVVLALAALLLSPTPGHKQSWRTVLFPLLSVLIGTSLVVVLFLSSEHIIKRENNFTRRFLQHPVLEDKIYDLKYNSYYFAGSHEGKIYLGNYTAPNILTIIDSSFTRTHSRTIRLDVFRQPFRSAKIKVEYPYFFVYDGSLPVVFKGLLDTMEANKTAMDTYFSQLEIITPNYFAFKTLSNLEKTNILGTVALKEVPDVSLHYDLLEKQAHGIFDTDGLLLRDKGDDNLIYGYFYRNEFLVMDRSLKLIRRLNTIDTVSKAQVKVRQLPDGTYKMEAPPLQVNKNMTAYNQVLLIQSNLMGRYESREIWDNASIVDMYATDEQRYLGSFFINDRGKNKMAQMLLTDRYFYALSGNEILRYRLRNDIGVFQRGKPKNQQSRQNN
ncbi:MauE/DoxX family redox-associated membrane protein [Flavobacterium sp.]|uniref:MauE/DoxX family redox-associated membrane protein n=1 Tax=Flavobacterium sp. TaxID=239 RepID=UPI00261CBE86|nr:MauE/DoxX family redox-associated membrane protein [Flavobacterium sp.]